MDGYTRLAEIIKAHGYDLARRAGELPTPEQPAADWHDTVYRPGVDAVRRAGLPELYASCNPTDADLLLWSTSCVAIYARMTPRWTSMLPRRTRAGEGTRAFETRGPARRQPAPTELTVILGAGPNVLRGHRARFGRGGMAGALPLRLTAGAVAHGLRSPPP